MGVIADKLERVAIALEKLAAAFGRQPNDPRESGPFTYEPSWPYGGTMPYGGPVPTPTPTPEAIPVPVGPSGPRWAHHGAELPWPGSPQGTTLHLAQSMTLKIKPPPGFKGTITVAGAAGSSPWSTQVTNVSLSMEGKLAANLSPASIMFVTPELEGGREYDLVVRMDQPGGLDLSLV